MKNELDLQRVLGLSQHKDLVDILYKIVNVFNFRQLPTEELGTQLVKNVTYLLRSALSEENFRVHLSLPKLFSRCSFLARKMMLNVT